MLRAAVVVAFALVTGTAYAQRVVAIAPLTAAGTEDTSASTRELTAELEAAVARLPGVTVISAAAVGDAIKKAKKPQLRSCDFEPPCLAEVGKLVGATIVIAGEVVGLGDAKVVYLGASDVATVKELRSTTLTAGGKDDAGGVTGASVRLLEPQRFVGTLRFAIDARGATVYVNGSKAPLSATGAIELPVGTQAVRVTHREYHDFVRFIDVEYGKTTQVDVGMKQYPIVRRDLQGKPTNLDQITYVDPPVWRRWYVTVPVAMGLAIVAGALAGYIAHGLPDGQCRKVGGDPC